MPRHPQDPHLYAVLWDGKPIAAVRAMSTPEARDYVLEQRLVVEKLTPSRAFQLATQTEFGIDSAKPEYAEPDDVRQGDFWGGQLLDGIPLPIEIVPLPKPFPQVDAAPSYTDGQQPDTNEA